MAKFNTVAVVGLLLLALASAPASAKGNDGVNGGGNSGNSGGNGGGGASFVLPDCQLDDIGPNASACVGFFDNNLLNASNFDVQKDYLTQLGLNLEGTWQNLVDAGRVLSPLMGSTTIDFPDLLFGTTYVGIHFGGGSPTTGVGGQSTVFYRFDAGDDGLDAFTLERYTSGSSNAVLYSTGLDPDGSPNEVGAVPEPAAWAMMILASGMAGASLRGKRRAALSMT